MCLRTLGHNSSVHPGTQAAISWGCPPWWIRVVGPREGKINFLAPGLGITFSLCSESCKFCSQTSRSWQVWISHGALSPCQWLLCILACDEIPTSNIQTNTCRGISGKVLLLKETQGDFPGGAVVKNPPANAGDTDSSPGPGSSHMPRSNQARAPQLLSLRSRDREPQLLSPHATTTEARVPRARALQQEKPPQWEAE